MPFGDESHDTAGIVRPSETDLNMPQDTTQPRRIGKYAIDQEIGRGGMGVVYLANDMELGRRVALKVIPTRADQAPENFARLMSEARALARINHPNIPQVYGAGQTENYSFISREFVEGENLLDVLDHRGTLGIKTSIRIIRDVAYALASVHARRILHRDIKTENLILDQRGRVQIVDFGIAKDLKSKIRMTRNDCYVGTLEYCSPEQLLGEELSPRTDIYSLGVVLYELLTGSLPYTGSTSAQIYSRMMKYRHRRLRDIRPLVPRSVERFANRLLQLDEKRRISDSLKVVQAAQKILRRLSRRR